MTARNPLWYVLAILLTISGLVGIAAFAYSQHLFGWGEKSNEATTPNCININSENMCERNGNTLATEPSQPADPCIQVAGNRWCPEGYTASDSTNPVTNTQALTTTPSLNAQGDGYVPGTQLSSCTEKDYEAHPGEVVLIGFGCAAKGDVSTGPSKDGPWTPQYDTIGSTGTLVICEKSEGCWIRADYGANISQRSYADLYKEMTKTGCESGCQEVMVIVCGPNGPENTSELPSNSAPQSGECVCPPDDGGQTPPATETPVPGCPGTCPTQVPPAPAPMPITNCDFSIPRGQSAQVPAGCLVAGDVEVGKNMENLTILYDSKQETGLIVVMNQTGLVRAPFGASVTSASLDDTRRAMDATGCGLANGCADINVVQYP